MLCTTSPETNTNGNVYVVGVDGTSDDLDRPCAAIFGDVEFKHKHRVSSVVCGYLDN